MIIYKITNLVNGKIYIGQTVGEFRKRKSQHLNSDKKLPLYMAFDKYGRENFSFEVVCTALQPQHLNHLERHFIAYYDCMAPKGYNMTSGGDSAFSRSEETKLRQRDAMLGHEVSPLTRRKIAATLMGNPSPRKGATLSPETRAKIGQAQIGRKASEDTKVRMREAHKSRKIYNAKPVQCVETGEMFSSTGAAALALGLVQSSISAVCLGKRKSTGGLTFRYVKA